MAYHTFTIELRVSFKDPEKEQIMREAAKVAAKHLYSTALLIADDDRQPQIMLQGGDFFTPTEEINLAEDIPE